MRAHRRLPRVVVSACLNLFPYRYNGEVITVPVLKRLATCFEWIPVCPEVAIGLPVPRPPIRIVLEPTRTGLRKRMLQTGTGRDLTDAIVHFSERFLHAFRNVDGFVLKSRSPSCGIDDTKAFRNVDDPDPIERTSGVFTDSVRRICPHVPVIDETRIADPLHLDGFLTAVYMHYRWRTLAARGNRTPVWTSPIAAWLRAYLPDDVGLPAERAFPRWSDVWPYVLASMQNTTVYRSRTISLLQEAHAAVCRSETCGIVSTDGPYAVPFQWRVHIWQRMRSYPDIRRRYRAVVAPYPIAWARRLQTAHDL